jgi:hypothetical protein
MNRKNFCLKYSKLTEFGRIESDRSIIILGGGHGDHILEITCSKQIPDVPPGTEVEIALFPLDEQYLSELKGLALQGREIAARLNEFSRQSS